MICDNPCYASPLIPRLTTLNSRYGPLVVLQLSAEQVPRCYSAAIDTVHTGSRRIVSPGIRSTGSDKNMKKEEGQHSLADNGTTDMLESKGNPPGKLGSFITIALKMRKHPGSSILSALKLVTMNMKRANRPVKKDESKRKGCFTILLPWNLWRFLFFGVSSISPPPPVFHSLRSCRCSDKGELSWKTDRVKQNTTLDVSNPEPRMRHKDVTAKRQQCVQQIPQCRRKPEQMEETM
ncbi:hypothetical protein EYF80_028064 [Liparis tanakae]|uniref:Uncharacterized protein n=1 Tax=Liparis tanakae TaxID=230148 RepID=A0A4Z2HA86_9TELE|nr:hypothetical protein EYF80_028064 [Liparis tanakae]